jgi:starch-binding outer membrane protein, SusD/RagB family
MNRINKRMTLKIVCSLLLIASLGGCKKFLDQEPVNSLTKDEFFQTEADANSAIIGVYNSLQQSNDQFFRWGELRGDLITSSNASDPVFLQQFDNESYLSHWAEPYKLIANANIVIEKVPSIPAKDRNFTEQESKKIVAEALFLRSLTYFYLVRAFKEVPLVLQAPTSDAVNFLLPKSSSDTILNQIEKDLAIAELDAPVSYARPLDMRGRVTKAAVNALQTDVYLWRAKYAEAAAASKKILDNKTDYQLVSSDDWFNIFARKNTSESILEIQYDYQLQETGRMKALTDGYSQNNFPFQGRNTNFPGQIINTTLYDIFTQENDLIRGLNATYSEVQARKFWKYIGLTRDNQARAIDDANFIIYRLADVMLMRAEALIHLGAAEKIEAAALINEVRKRAQLDELDFINENTPISDFIQIILKERAMELAFEGKRWFDLVRIATNEKDPEILLSRVVTSRSVANRAQVRSRLIDPRSWYLPILRTELAINSNLVQNPYYK